MDWLNGFALGVGVGLLMWLAYDVWSIIWEVWKVADTTVLMNGLITARKNFTLGLTAPNPTWQLRLFVNNRVPLCTDVLGDYTQCTLPGYAAVTLIPANWAGSLIACVDTQTYPTVTFSFSGGIQTIYGSFLYDTANGVLGWVTLWDTPFVVPTGGGAVDVSLQWVEKQCA